MKTTLTKQELKTIRTTLTKANRLFSKNHTGESQRRQPVHTVYGGAHLFQSTTAKKIGEIAQKNLSDYAASGRALFQSLEKGASERAWDRLTAKQREMWNDIHQRIVQKLKQEAVEDFRIDFEDGYGYRPGPEEDEHAEKTAKETAKGMAEKTLPPFIGMRIKPFSEECVDRSIRTLDIFLSTLAQEAKRKLPENFVITLPKIQMKEQVESFVKTLATLEKKLKLKPNTINCELMIEAPQAIIDSEGVTPLRSFLQAAKGRCTSMHFGTYDYSSSCGITAHQQTMLNPVCDFAKHILQVSLAGTPVFLSDGATNLLPIGPHKGNGLSIQQREENTKVVHRAWQLSYQHIRHSLSTGYYQGWDLHPAQIPVRYAAVYAFFLEGYQQAAERLRGFIEKAAQATLLGDVFDDAATGQGLLNYFLRALSCGAITEEDLAATGLSLEQIRSRSFLKIIRNYSPPSK